VINLRWCLYVFNWFRQLTPQPRGEQAKPTLQAARTSHAGEVNPADLSNQHKQRGNAFFADGRLPDAAACFEQAIVALPTNAAAHFNLALVRRDQGRMQEATTAFEQAFAADPAMADAMFLLGDLQIGQGQPLEALRSYESALAVDDSIADLHNNLGLVLQALGRFGAALSAFDRALSLNARLQPADDASPQAAMHSNRALALAALRRPAEAQLAFSRALQLDPAHFAAHNGLGLVYATQEQHAKALECFDQALALEPGHADALGNRATALGLLQRREEALNALQQLHAMAPESDYAIGRLLDAKVHACEWDGLDALIDDAAQAMRAGRRAVHPFTWLALCNSPELQLRCSRIYTAHHYPPNALQIRARERSQDGRIRLAYLSADFYSHATAHLMAELFERHDRTSFETIALSFGPDRRDAMRSRLAGAFDRFIDVRHLSDEAIAAYARELRVDIAIDLKGFTADARPGIFTWRAAPVQVSYVGYPGTLGMESMDYVIADQQLASPADAAWFSEKLVRLPDSYQPNDSARAIAAQVPSRASQGLPEAGFVFCCFNNNYKISPAVWNIWIRLLHQLPGSVLWLFQGNELAAVNLRGHAARCGVAPERLMFAARAPLDEHLARHQLADLFLDTLPYNAHTTTSDALWAGLPVLTLKGHSFAARVAASLLHAVGLPELVTHNAQDYEALALQLASDPARLARLRAKLSMQRDAAPLFDAKRLCSHLESAYEVMYRRCQDGLPPEAFDVQPGANNTAQP
jgi:protein O-GlcNAc transferase